MELVSTGFNEAFVSTGLRDALLSTGLRSLLVEDVGDEVDAFVFSNSLCSVVVSVVSVEGSGGGDAVAAVGRTVLDGELWLVPKARRMRSRKGMAKVFSESDTLRCVLLKVVTRGTAGMASLKRLCGLQELWALPKQSGVAGSNLESTWPLPRVDGLGLR